MWVLLASLIVIACIALALGYVRNKRMQRMIENGELEEPSEPTEVDITCCGQHEVCEKESLLAAVSKNIEYYDDEELDHYIGSASDTYSPDQIEQFREVFYTMRDTDVAGWVRSLQLRGISLPDELKDEVFLVVGELRTVNLG